MPDDKLSRKGHRQRLRNQYLSGAMENAADHNLLELFLSTVIPRKDVKDLAYELINVFGSLEGVIAADPLELMNVSGVGENTAVAISCIKNINDRVIKNKNREVKRIISIDDAKKYCVNALCAETVEKVIQVDLRNNGSIINCHTISVGAVNCTNVDSGKIARNVVRDNAAYSFIAHNHPDGEAIASGSDIDFTFSLRTMLRNMNVSLIDHFIVAGNDCETIIHNPIFEKFSEKNK